MFFATLVNSKMSVPYVENFVTDDIEVAKQEIESIIAQPMAWAEESILGTTTLVTGTTENGWHASIVIMRFVSKGLI